MAQQTTDTIGKGLKDLNLTTEELTKFEKAFKDPEFLKLFEEYAKEVSDPKVKAETDQYLRQLEEQGRAEEVYGKGVQLITPTAALVIKSKVVGQAEAAAKASGAGQGQNGSALPVGQKVFINVCTSDKVGRYSLKDAKDANGRVGKTLSIPLTLGPVRVGTDKHGQPASVYDFVVHPDSVQFAKGNPAAFNSLAETALEHVEKVSSSKLSRGYRRLNIRYKATEGCTEPPVQTIRTAEGGEAVGGRLRPRADVPGADVPGARSAPSAAAAAATAGAPAAAASSEGSGKGSSSRSTFSFDRSKDKAKAKAEPEITDPAQPGYRHADGSVTPEWSLVHRGEADLAEAWKDAGRGLALGGSVPKELLVRVTLPDVSSAAAVDLDVGQRVLTLKVPGRYRLSVTLPYSVDDTKGRAKLDKARKQLEITLPVVPPPPPPRPPVAAPPAMVATTQGANDVQPAAPAPVSGAWDLPEGGAVNGEGSGRQPESSQVAAGVPDAAESDAGAQSGDGTGGVAAASGEDSAPDGAEVGAGDAGSREGAGAASDAAATEAEEAGAAGSGADGGRQLTENERRWMEIHARAHDEVDGSKVDVVGASNGDAAGQAGVGEAGQGAAVPQASPPAAVAEEPAPTVLLRPRLQSALAMELD